MRRLSLDNWVHVVTSTSVVAGLLLVAYELRQDTNFARAEAERAMISDWAAVTRAEFETDIMDIYVKSIEEPEELSSAEMLKLSAWLTATVGEFNLQVRMYELGLAEDPTGDLVGDFQFYLGSRFARAWYAESRHWLTPHLVEVIDREIERNPIESKSAYVESLRSRMNGLADEASN